MIIVFKLFVDTGEDFEHLDELRYDRQWRAHLVSHDRHDKLLLLELLF